MAEEQKRPEDVLEEILQEEFGEALEEKEGGDKNDIDDIEQEIEKELEEIISLDEDLEMTKSEEDSDKKLEETLDSLEESPLIKEIKQMEAQKEEIQKIKDEIIRAIESRFSKIEKGDKNVEIDLDPVVSMIEILGEKQESLSKKVESIAQTQEKMLAMLEAIYREAEESRKIREEIEKML